MTGQWSSCSHDYPSSPMINARSTPVRRQFDASSTLDQQRAQRRAAVRQSCDAETRRVPAGPRPALLSSSATLQEGRRLRSSSAATMPSPAGPQRQDARVDVLLGDDAVAGVGVRGQRFGSPFWRYAVANLLNRRSCVPAARRHRSPCDVAAHADGIGVVCAAKTDRMKEGFGPRYECRTATRSNVADSISVQGVDEADSVDECRSHMKP